MKESDPTTLSPDARLLIDKPNPGRAAASQYTIEIGNRKADVMNPGPSPSDEFSNRRRCIRRLEELHQRLASLKRLDASTIRV